MTRKHWYSAIPKKRIVRPYTGTTVCKNCKERYHTDITLQSGINKDIDYDVCPYCSAINQISKDVVYNNSKLDLNCTVQDTIIEDK